LRIAGLRDPGIVDDLAIEDWAIRLRIED